LLLDEKDSFVSSSIALTGIFTVTHPIVHTKTVQRSLPQFAQGAIIGLLAEANHSVYLTYRQISLQTPSYINQVCSCITTFGNAR
jgi:hypothetical protein